MPNWRAAALGELRAGLAGDVVGDFTPTPLDGVAAMPPVEPDGEVPANPLLPAAAAAVGVREKFVNVDVLRSVVVPARTAKPTCTVASIATVAVELKVVHVVPLLEIAAVNRLPARVIRSHVAVKLV